MKALAGFDPTEGMSKSARLVSKSEVGWSKSGLVLLRLPEIGILAFPPDLARQVANEMLAEAARFIPLKR